MAQAKNLSKAKKPSAKVATKNTNRKIQPEVVGLMVFVVIVALVFLIVFIITLTNHIAQDNLQSKLGDGAKVARMQRSPLNDMAHKIKINLITSSGVVDETVPVLSERLDTCMLVGIEQGWVYTNWQQKCFTTYVDYIPTTLPKDVAAGKISTVSGVAEQFGMIDIKDRNVDCRMYELNYSASLRYFSAAEESDRCKTLQYTSKGESGSIIEESRGKTLVVKSFEDNDFIKTRAYIRVDSRMNYYESERLGCKGLMCGPPLESAIPSFE